jgi:hypothetical protein
MFFFHHFKISAFHPFSVIPPSRSRPCPFRRRVPRLAAPRSSSPVFRQQPGRVVKIRRPSQSHAPGPFPRRIQQLPVRRHRPPMQRRARTSKPIPPQAALPSKQPSAAKLLPKFATKSLVPDLQTGGVGVAGSNPVVPINFFPDFVRVSAPWPEARG